VGCLRALVNLVAVPIDIAALLGTGGTLYGVPVVEVVVRTADGREQRLQLPVEVSAIATTDSEMVRDLIQWVAEQESGYEFIADVAAQGAGYQVPVSGSLRSALRELCDRDLITRIPGNRGFRVV
jgi:hypothetical protein